MIRIYNESDFEYLETIYNLSKRDEFIGEDFNIIVTPLSQDQPMLDLFYASKIYIYHMDAITGFIGLKDNYISWLFVHPEFRGQGIGKKLLSHALSLLDGEVILNVVRSNLIAVSLYKSLGFSVAREFIGHYQNNPVVVWKMSRVAKNE